MKLRAMLFLAFVFVCLLVSPALSEGVNRALLIGCDQFVSQEDTTPSSANNVTHMAEALAGGGMNMETLITRKNDVATLEDLQELIATAFSESADGDVNYFYISTHGVWEEGMPNADMALLLSNGETETALTAAMLRQMFDQVQGTKVLILDACHAGAVIGKGVHAPFDNVFMGKDYKVICSSGGAEQSWFWSGADTDDAMVGAGYFSGAVVSGISVKGGYGADNNRDGVITLTELRRFLRDNHGASTVQTYPEEDDFPFLVYDADSYTGRRRDNAVEGVSFLGDVLSRDYPAVDFGFTVLRPVQVAYQVTYQKDGRWDFDHSELLYDQAESRGLLSPGMKERSLALDLSDAGEYGYALLQLITRSGGQTSLAASRALCVPPSAGDPQLEILSQSSFCPDVGEELGMVIHHVFPCELTVTVQDMNGKTVRRLASRDASRPQQLMPRGSTFFWNGRRSNGDMAAPGQYRIHIKAHVGDEVYEVLSDPVTLLVSQG